MVTLQEIVRKKQASKDPNAFLAMMADAFLKSKFEEFKQEVQTEIKPWVDELVAGLIKEGLRGATGPAGPAGPAKDGAPGKNADDLDEVALRVSRLLPIPRNGLDGLVGPQGEPGATPKAGKDYPTFVQVQGWVEDTIVRKLREYEMISTALITQTLKDALLQLQEDFEKKFDALTRRTADRPRFSGSGDSILAGSGVTITSSGGRKTISASGSNTKVRDETPTGSGTSFTLAHTPAANTLQLFRGGARQSIAGGDYTRVGTAITLTVTLGAGESLSADYEY